MRVPPVYVQKERPGMKSEITGDNEVLFCLFLSQELKVHSCGCCGEDR